MYTGALPVGFRHSAQHRPLCAWVLLVLVSCSLKTELHRTWAAARLPFRICHQHPGPSCLADAHLTATACRATPPTCPWRDVTEKDVPCNVTTKVLGCLDRLFTVRHRAAHGALVVHRRQARTISIRKILRDLHCLVVARVMMWQFEHIEDLCRQLRNDYAHLLSSSEEDARGACKAAISNRSN